MQEAPSIEKTYIFSCGESGWPEAVRRIKVVPGVSVSSCTEDVPAVWETVNGRSW